MVGIVIVENQNVGGKYRVGILGKGVSKEARLCVGMCSWMLDV